MRHDDLELGKVDADVVEHDRVGIHVSRTGEDRRSGVHHDHHAELFGARVDFVQPRRAFAIGVGSDFLMRWVELDRSDAEVDQPIDLIPACVRIDATKRNHALRRVTRELGDPRVHVLGKAHQRRADVVDDPDPRDSSRIHRAKDQLGIVHQPLELIEFPTTLGHPRTGAGLELVPRLDVDVGVGDPKFQRAP
jgi:hypothetical protein